MAKYYDAKVLKCIIYVHFVICDYSNMSIDVVSSNSRRVDIRRS